ncbi:hypothetical protein XELAEV_18008487mg [Xenopus laevis]|uniref:Uncharacterized protein n=1 Tax=Xenopus laevis TaxID=8355 RepID=A0A974I6A5_XENLA|nr:hypothetical protein XELAEV_18008487mg [Xenopus laevis]
MYSEHFYYIGFCPIVHWVIFNIANLYVGLMFLVIFLGTGSGFMGVFFLWKGEVIHPGVVGINNDLDLQ